MNSDGCGRFGLAGVAEGGGKEMVGDMLRNVLNATCHGSVSLLSG